MFEGEEISTVLAEELPHETYIIQETISKLNAWTWLIYGSSINRAAKAYGSRCGRDEGATGV